VLALLGASLPSACGRSATANPVEAKLEREDLVAVTRLLRGAEPAVAREVASARAAWPLLLDGLPAHPSAAAAERILGAVSAAQHLPLPGLLAEPQAAALTGPASPLAGRYRDFQQLASASWRQIGFALTAVQAGSPRAAGFARATVALYIEGVYDAHYSLAETGTEAAGAYTTLGGAGELGRALGIDEVEQIERSYSPAADRLEPHARVKLGG